MFVFPQDSGDCELWMYFFVGIETIRYMYYGWIPRMV